MGFCLHRRSYLLGSPRNIVLYRYTWSKNDFWLKKLPAHREEKTPSPPPLPVYHIFCTALLGVVVYTSHLTNDILMEKKVTHTPTKNLLFFPFSRLFITFFTSIYLFQLPPFRCNSDTCGVAWQALSLPPSHHGVSALYTYIPWQRLGISPSVVTLSRRNVYTRTLPVQQHCCMYQPTALSCVKMFVQCVSFRSRKSPLYYTSKYILDYRGIL